MLTRLTRFAPCDDKWSVCLFRSSLPASRWLALIPSLASGSGESRHRKEAERWEKKRRDTASSSARAMIGVGTFFVKCALTATFFKHTKRLAD